MGIYQDAAKAYHDHCTEAEKAWNLFREICDYPVPRVPGMDTIIRLAWRIECGKTIEEAAWREWFYRMSLATDRWRVFGSPALLGQ